jgi:S-(hydroxymethyl)glutathione dehydrogenase/alcohol dehydrogenase
MERNYRAAVLAGAGQKHRIETVRTAPLGAKDVLVRVRAAGLCHTDLEVIDGSLRVPMPVVLGHEAAGIVEEVGGEVEHVVPGDHVVLSWNPRCGHCFYCDRDLPILCAQYLANGPKALQFDGRPRAFRADGEQLHALMFLGAFGEFCMVDGQQAVPIDREMPFDRACLLGCAVMTGVGAARNIAHIEPGACVLVIGCGAVGLAALQGARLAGAGTVFAVDLRDEKLSLAKSLGAVPLHGERDDVLAAVRGATDGRGADVVLESAGAPSAFRLTTEAVRPGGEVVWLGKLDVERDVGFRWGSLMQEKRIRRSSYGGAEPARDFPWLARAYLDLQLVLDPLISRRITLDELDDGFAALRNGETIRSVVMFS